MNKDKIPSYINGEKVNEKNNNSEDLVDIYPAALMILNPKAEIYNLNKQLCLLLGREKRDLIGKNISEIVEAEDLAPFMEIFNTSMQLFSNGNDIAPSAEIRIKRADNNYFPFLFIMKCSIIPSENNSFCFITLIDITFQKMKEELLKDSEARFESIANTAPVMIWIADVNGLFSFVNKVWLDYAGKEIGNQLGLNWLKDVHPEDQERLLNIYKDAFTSKNAFVHEFRLKGKDNNYEWMMIKGTPRFIREKVFIGFIGSCININAQKEFEEKIKKVNLELIGLNAAKDKFFSIISHDLRGPLGALMGILEVLSESYDDFDDIYKKNIISEAALSAKKTFGLMENLLDWSRMQAGRIPYEPEKLKLLSIINNLDSLFKQNLKNKNLTLKTDINPDIFVYADKRMTETIFRNLISNAIKFSYPGNSISISAKKEEKNILISVADKGVGIDPKHLAELFKNNFSHSTQGTAKESGTGLGLVLSQELVEKQAGKIWVNSKLNEGTTFYLTLPVYSNE